MLVYSMTLLDLVVAYVDSFIASGHWAGDRLHGGRFECRTAGWHGWMEATCENDVRGVESTCSRCRCIKTFFSDVLMRDTRWPSAVGQDLHWRIRMKILSEIIFAYEFD